MIIDLFFLDDSSTAAMSTPMDHATTNDPTQISIGTLVPPGLDATGTGPGSAKPNKRAPISIGTVAPAGLAMSTGRGSVNSKKRAHDSSALTRSTALLLTNGSTEVKLSSLARAATAAAAADDEETAVKKLRLGSQIEDLFLEDVTPLLNKDEDELLDFA